MRVDLSLIGGANGTLAPISRLRLNLFLETDFVAVLQRFEQTGSGYAWIGKIEGEPLSSVILVTVDRTVSGSVTVPGRTYAIRAADGVGTVSEIEERLLPRSADDAIPAPPEPAPPASGGPDPNVAADDGALIDIAVVYSGTALRGAASEAQLRADIDLAVATTNQAFSNSGVRTRLRQVHTGPIDYEDSGVALTDLTRLTERSDGIMDDVHALRDSTGADLVALITERDDTLCGQAYTLNPDSRGDYGFSLTRRECLQYLTFAHEVGHNFGACHDWYVKSTCEGEAFTYSFGHVEPEHRRLTIMAYYNLCEALAIDCDQIAWFSNPRIHIEGTDRPLGVPAGTDTTCPEGDTGHYRCDADNVRTLNAMAGVVARFKASRSTGRTFPATLDFTCHGYVEAAGTHAYNCIPAPAQQHHMRTFVQPPGSLCNEGSTSSSRRGVSSREGRAHTTASPRRSSSTTCGCRCNQGKRPGVPAGASRLPRSRGRQEPAGQDPHPLRLAAGGAGRYGPAAGCTSSGGICGSSLPEVLEASAEDAAAQGDDRCRRA